MRKINNIVNSSYNFGPLYSVSLTQPRYQVTSGMVRGTRSPHIIMCMITIHGKLMLRVYYTEYKMSRMQILRQSITAKFDTL